MRRERLKDQIEKPRVSVFDTTVRALVILISLGAVYYAFSGRSLPFTNKPGDTTRAAVASSLTVTVTTSGAFYWNKDGPIARAEFVPRLAAWLKDVPNPTVVITGDQFASLADTLGLADEARRQGITNVRIESPPRGTP